MTHPRTVPDARRITVLDPTFEDDAEPVVLAARLTTLEGATVGIISNGKSNTRPFFAHLARILRDEWQVASVVLRTKSNYSAPAEVELINEASTWGAMFSGIGD